MICHVVPAVYLRSWRSFDHRDSIYIFKKDNYKLGEIKNIKKMSETNFATKDLYVLQANRFYTAIFKEECKKLYEESAKYKIVNGDLAIETFDEYIKYYDNGLGFKYYDKDSDEEIVSFNNTLNKIWGKNISKIIENYFDIELENKWNFFLEYLNDTLLKKKTFMVRDEYFEYLAEFIIVQLFRRFENVKLFGIEPTLKTITQSMNSDGLEKYLMNDKEFCDTFCINHIYRFIKYKASDKKEYNKNSIVKVIKWMSQEIQIVFLISNSVDFITSDNPCFISKTNNAMGDTTIFMPINKSVCAMFVRKSSNMKSNKHYLMNISSGNVKYLNYLVAKNCISHIAYDTENDISELIDSKFNEAEWGTMFNECNLTCLTCFRE